MGFLSDALGLLRKKDSAQKNSRLAILGQAAGARQAAEKYGFNPLTLLGASSGIGPSDGGAAPLASASILLDGLMDLGQERGGSDAQQQAVKTFRRDLNTLQLDQTRSGVLVDVPHHARAGFSTPSPLGGNSVTVTPSNGAVASGAAVQGGEHGPFGNPNLGLPDDSGAVALPDPRLDRGSGLYGFGLHWKPAPGFSPASVFEEEYGDSEVASTGYFGLKAGADLLYNGGRLWDYVTAPDQTFTRGGERWEGGDTRKEEYPPSYWPRIRYTSPKYRE